MAFDHEEVLEELRLMRVLLTTLQAKLTDVITGVAAFDLPQKSAAPACPVCSMRLPRIEDALRDHLANVHGASEEQLADILGPIA